MIPSLMSGESKTSLPREDFDDSEGSTILDELRRSLKHMYLSEIRENYLVFKLPERYSCCKSHSGYDVSEEVELGQGAFGRVRAINGEVVCKQFFESLNFYHELFWCELIALAKIRNSSGDGERLLTPLTACVPCKQLFFKRYSRSLKDFEEWTPQVVGQMVSEFRELYSAVMFLNEKCGIMHSDISVDNILVEEAPVGLGKLYLTDFGVCALHSANPVTDAVIKSKKGRVVSRISSERSVFSLSKDAYKPCLILARCYAHTLTENPEAHDEFIIHSSTAAKIDVICLGNCLLTCIEKILDVHNVNPIETFRDMYLDFCDSSTYYLLLLSSRVVITQFLSTIWDVQVTANIDAHGICPSLSLRETHRRLFKNWCAAYLKLVQRCCSVASIQAVSCGELKDLFIKLLDSDVFTIENV